MELVETMATKTTEKQDSQVTEASAPDSPLLDLSDAAVKRMIKNAKKRGYVTHEQLNEVLPSEEVTSDQIEDIYAMLNEMGINVVEAEDNDDSEGEEPAAAEEEEAESTDLTETRTTAVATTPRAEPAAELAGAC
jgi:RNA polymerase primary sigma factor